MTSSLSRSSARFARGWFPPVLLVIGLVLLFVVVRREILWDPPYWDHALSLWPEADDLARKRLDLVQHWLREPTWLAGGNAAYRFSVLPIFISGLMLTLPSPAETFLAYRLFTFLCAAVLLVVLFRVFARSEGRWLSFLAVVGVATAPIFSTQIDMLGMEIPLALCGVVSASMVADRRYALAAVAAFAGMFVKATMLLVLLAIASTVVVQLLFGSRRDAQCRRRLWRGLLACCVMVPLAALLLVAVEGDAVARFVRFEPIRWVIPVLWSPDLACIGIGGSLAYVVWLFRRPRSSSAAGGFSERLSSEPLALFSVILLVGTLFSFAFILSLPRYLAFAMPYFAALLLTSLRVHRFSVPARTAVFLCWIAWNLVNWNGTFLPSDRAISLVLQQRETDLGEREGSLLERSRAYLVDHRSNMAAMKAMDDAWDGAPIFAGAPFANFLAIPALGYVDRPLAGYVTNGFHHRVGAFRDAAHSVVDRPEAAWFVYSRNPFYQRIAWFVIPPYDPGSDNLLYDDRQASPLVIFRRTIAADDREPFVGNWYLEQLRTHPEWPGAPWMSPRESLKRIGREDIWKRYVRETSQSTTTARER